MDTLQTLIESFPQSAALRIKRKMGETEIIYEVKYGHESSMMGTNLIEVLTKYLSTITNTTKGNYTP